MQSFDIAIVGAGIAGASAAYALAPKRKVVLLERESQPGYHTTGRSAALFIATYGNAVMRALNHMSAPFLMSPPSGFTGHPVLTPRGVLFIGTHEQGAEVDALFEEGRALTKNLQRLGTDAVLAMCPIVQRDAAAAGGIYEPDAMDIDVHALHHGYLRHAAALGATIVQNAEVRALTHDRDTWTVQTSAGVFSAAIVINAAGAWCDEIAALAGAQPIGLEPKRRTAITFDPPAGVDIHTWPAVGAVDETWYFKPDAGRILASPADETPSPPCDAQPDEYDVAVVVDRIETFTTMKVRRIVSKWAGLRSFVHDRTVVAGFDAARPGFFWLAGQGGYGIQTSPAMGRVAAALIESGDIPTELRNLGVSASMLSPSRLR